MSSAHTDSTKSKSPHIALLESSVQSKQHFQSNARYGKHESTCVAGKL